MESSNSQGNCLISMESFELASLTLAIALVLGIIVQSIAKHLRLPGIILALLAGIAIGPDGLHIINPNALGDTLNFIIGIAVAIILFEGGMLLNIKRLKKEAVVLRRMITYGAVITAVLAGVMAWAILGWEWRPCVLFGTLVIVTGPTVITPLLRKIRANQKLTTILEGEGVLIDPVGAIIAIVGLQVVLHATTASFFAGLLDFHLKLIIGFGIGLSGGYILTLLLRSEVLVPEEFETTLTVTFVLFIFEISNYINHESGIMAVVIAGMVVGNSKIPQHRHLLETKEQITAMMIGMLFILLSADVRLSDVEHLGYRGLLVVVLLMLVVRPVNVWACTYKSDLTLKEKVFIAWLGPRGIIAAAVASLFVIDMKKANIEGGEELRALVFMVIFVTVVIQGLTASPLAQLLGLKRKHKTGFIFAGASPLTLIVASILSKRHEDIVLIDRNATDSQIAESEGFKVIWGNALADSILQRAEVDAKLAVIGLTPNYAVNAMFLNKVKEMTKEPLLLGALTESTNMGKVTFKQSGGYPVFATDVDFDLWSHLIKGGKAEVIEYIFKGDRSFDVLKGNCLISDIPATLPLVIENGNDMMPIYPGLKVSHGSKLYFLIETRRKEEAHQALSNCNFALADHA